jgi:hypothetical protein
LGSANSREKDSNVNVKATQELTHLVGTKVTVMEDVLQQVEGNVTVTQELTRSVDDNVKVTKHGTPIVSVSL